MVLSSHWELISLKAWLSDTYSEGFFWGIFQDLITKVLFWKKLWTNIRILIYYYTGEFYCFKIIKTYTNWMADVLDFQAVDDLTNLT